MLESPSSEPKTSPEVAFFDKLLGNITSLSKDFLIYGFGSSLSMVVGLITLPILTRVLSVEEFGSVDLINATMGYFMVLVVYNLGSGLWRYYYEIPPDDHRQRQEMVSSILWFSLAVSILVAVLLIFLSDAISEWLFQSTDLSSSIRLVAYSLPFMAIFRKFIGIQRLKQRPAIFLTVNIGHSMLTFALTIFFITVYKMGVQGIFLAQLIGYAVAALVSTWLVWDLLALTFSKTWFIRMAAYGLPQVPGSLINWSMVAVNRYFVNAYTSTVDVGYYSMATKVSQVMMLLVTSFTMAWQPFMLSRINDPDSPKVYPLVLNYYLIGTLAVASVLTIFAREFILLLSTPEYLPAVALVGLLVLRQILQGFSYIANIGIVVAKRTIFMSLSLGLGFIVNLVANFTLTSRFGIYGAAISEVLGYLVAGIAVLIASNLLYPVVRWNYPVMIQTSLAFGVIVGFSIVSYTLHVNFQWMLLIKFGVLFAFWAFLLKFIDGPQRKVLLKIPQLILPKR